jgi:nucleotide-binding universal stress UspA family protein
VDIRQRYGELEETLLEQEERVRLIVLGRRGRSAETTQRDLGRNVERVVRALHRPILTVTEGFSEPVGTTK